jgi:hypothetical protein
VNINVLYCLFITVLARTSSVSTGISSGVSKTAAVLDIKLPKGREFEAN